MSERVFSGNLLAMPGLCWCTVVPRRQLAVGSWQLGTGAADRFFSRQRAELLFVLIAHKAQRKRACQRASWVLDQGLHRHLQC